MDTKLTIEEINKIIACPKCKESILLSEGEDALCRRCGESYRWHSGFWDLMPSGFRSSSDLWSVWDQLQANGLVGYIQDSEHNLGVGQRPDCLEFSRFCRFDGMVLDMGCGPQAWPAYFQVRSDATRFVGVDPLIEASSPNYSQFRALAEFLPFRESIFDHVVLATSIDHFVDPVRALLEGKRVCRFGGEIAIWLGEKKPGAPKPTVSPQWFRSLRKPGGAEDLFHLKRLTPHDIKDFVIRAGLKIAEEQIYREDEFRANCFYRIRVK